MTGRTNIGYGIKNSSRILGVSEFFDPISNTSVAKSFPMNIEGATGQMICGHPTICGGVTFIAAGEGDWY